jgi:hypothetical protein
MTHTDFNHILSSLKTLSPEQVRQLRLQLDRQLAQPKTRTAKPSGKTAKRTKATPPKKKMTEAEFDQHLLKIGLLSQLPDTDADFDDPDDVPVDIKGEPLSETVIRERR